MGIRKPGRRDRGLNAAQIVLLSFSLFIVIGMVLLSLPIAHRSPHLWVDDLFMATSAVCVTGLVTLDPSTDYTLFGQWVIMLLIQAGGLGYMTLFTVGVVLVGRRLSMRDRLNLQQVTDQPGLTGLVSFILNVLGLTLVVEGIGFALICLYTIPAHGWAEGSFLALFHAISAFNNAGFTLFPEGLVRWQQQEGLLLIIATMVIIGGLGYPVSNELVRRFLLRRKPEPRWNVLITVVLVTSAWLLIIGMGVFWAFEARNPDTLGGMPFHTQAVNAFFMGTTPRSSGFNTVPTNELTLPSLMVLMVLMVSGGGPGGTAGGIKLTTAVVLVAVVASVVRGQSDVNLLGLKRRVGDAVVRKSITVFFLTVGLIVGVAFLLVALEPLPFLPLAFEAVSAGGIVGLSMGVTSQLGMASKLLLIATMLAGRVGVLFLLLAFFPTRRGTTIRYAEEPMLVG